VSSQPRQTLTASAGVQPLVELPRMAANMKFVGLFTIIYGAISCISIIGAIVGVPTIIMGLRIREAADAFNQYNEGRDTRSLENAVRLQTTYFLIQKIFIIIGLVLFALYIVGYVLLIAIVFSSE